MQVSEFKDQLLMSAGVNPERIMEFSCGTYVATPPTCSYTAMKTSCSPSLCTMVM